ncbi:hypothetical protein SFRURICE_002193 [Spodoptera frugiperda]|nr:hypothetical protein SFRURICE_002193 [Spodoptera frugiperda]
MYSRDSVGVRQQSGGQREQQRRAAGARPERAHSAWSAGGVARRTGPPRRAPPPARRAPARPVSTAALRPRPGAHCRLHRHADATRRPATHSYTYSRQLNISHRLALIEHFFTCTYHNMSDYRIRTNVGMSNVWSTLSDA